MGKREEELIAQYPARLKAVEAERDRLRELLKELADDLAEWVEHHYEQTKEHPAIARRYRRDMEPVLRARAALKDTP